MPAWTSPVRWLRGSPARAPRRPGHKLDTGVQVELGHDVIEVRPHRGGADTQLIGYLLRR